MSAVDWLEESGVWDRDRAVLDERPRWRKSKGTAVGEDLRAVVVSVGSENSASRKRRLLVSESAQGEVGRLVVVKGAGSSSLPAQVSGGGGGSGRISKKDSGCFSSICSSSTPWSRCFGMEPVSENVEGRLIS